MQVVDFRGFSVSQQFSVLADAGLYGVFAPLSTGGLDLDLRTMRSRPKSLRLRVSRQHLCGSSISDSTCSSRPTTPDSIRETPATRRKRTDQRWRALGGLLPALPRLRATETRDGWISMERLHGLVAGEC